MAEPVRVRILGVGMGPQHVTPEVAAALRSVDYVLAADKADSESDDGLLALRRAIVDAHTDGAVEVVEVRDPVRDRSTGLTTAGYEGTVAGWHD
ncbi:MAG: precorrin-6A synthase (deacetylating), partial [Mycobacterium sp.]